ncbi:MAG: magnesium transporter MgtE N-terminal domain-containing protein, partial [Candidatus Dormibacteria bacterium]
MAISAAAATDAPAAQLWLTELIKGRLVDRSGERLGRVDDVIVRLAEGGHPPVTGLVGRIAGRRLFIPGDHLDTIANSCVQLSGATLNLARFERRQGEVLLRADVLDRRMISVHTGRLITAHDIELVRNAEWRVGGVDTGPGGVLARLLPRSMRKRSHDVHAFVDWRDVEPFVGHVPTSRLLIPLRRLRTLHPAQIADIVEHASHDEGEEIITAVHADPELEADVFEELDIEHQVEFLRERSDGEAAAVLASMNADDAADLITEVEQERRLPILGLLPPAQQVKIRALLGYGADSAGGLMSPDFVTVPQDASVSDAMRAVRAAKVSHQASADVFLIDTENKLAGAVPLVALVQHGDGEKVAELMVRSRTFVRADDDFPEVARIMADFNLTCAPVVDDDERIIGVITVDDVLEAMLPDSWRRRAEA